MDGSSFSFLVVYAPQEGLKEAKKDGFYHELIVAMNLFKEGTNLSRFTLVAVPQIGQHTPTIKEVGQFIRKNLCQNTRFLDFLLPKKTTFSNFMRQVKP